MKTNILFLTVLISITIACNPQYSSDNAEVITRDEIVNTTSASTERSSNNLPLHQRLLKSPTFEKVATDMLLLEKQYLNRMAEDKKILKNSVKRKERFF
ncbi:MAG: hypothetical protein OHK0038_24720 [Flammeovirgaceae bacterium]